MPKPTTEQPVGITAASLTLLTAALWGGTPVAISYSVDTLPPVAVAAIRFALAFAFMLVWCLCGKISIRLESGQTRFVVIVGTLLFVQITTFNLGVYWSNSSHSTLLINTFVFWVVLIEQFVTHRTSLSRSKIVGLLLAGSGVVVLFVFTGQSGDPSTADQPDVWGDAMLMISAAVLAVKITYTKHAVRFVEPGKLILWHHLVGVALFTACSLATEKVSYDSFTTPAVLGLLYQGLFVAGLCFAIQAYLLRQHAASAIAVFSFSTPLFGLVLAWLFRGDQLSSWLAVSAACVAGGIYLVNKSS